jgi:hypothetical protein
MRSIANYQFVAAIHYRRSLVFVALFTISFDADARAPRRIQRQVRQIEMPAGQILAHAGC